MKKVTLIALTCFFSGHASALTMYEAALQAQRDAQTMWNSSSNLYANGDIPGANSLALQGKDKLNASDNMFFRAQTEGYYIDDQIVANGSIMTGLNYVIGRTGGEPIGGGSSGGICSYDVQLSSVHWDISSQLDSVSGEGECSAICGTSPIGTGHKSNCTFSEN